MPRFSRTAAGSSKTPNLTRKPMKTFKDFLDAARREKAAAREKYDADARLPLDEKLRSGAVAGPLVFSELADGEALFRPHPAVDFDYGKVNPGSTVHVTKYDVIPSLTTSLPKGRLSPETAPNTFKRDPHCRNALNLQPGEVCIFPPVFFDSSSQIIFILEKCCGSDEWPGSQPAAPPAEPGQSARDRAQAACLNEKLPIVWIKGPPGTGKTDLLAEVAVNLASQGKKVGLVAVSHAAVDNALERCRDKTSLPLLIEKRGGAGKKNGKKQDPHILGSVTASASYLIKPGGSGGTGLTSKNGKFDVLLLDEAGQIPVFEAAALSLLAPRMILFGDENQLPNICHGQHPRGSYGGSSAMAYIRDVLPGCGCSLEISHRMNSAICGLIQCHFYPDIPGLTPGKNQDSHLLDGVKPFPSLVKDDFPHKHPRLSRCEEEAARVVKWVQCLLRMQVVVDGQPARPMTTHDIAILTPFRAHASAISNALSKAKIPHLDKLRIGTVDKMQGQGAAAVIYSMAASAKDYIAGITEWLFSPNRWNVAISRAMACAIVVGDMEAHFGASPDALDGIAAQQKIRELLQDSAWTPHAP